MPLMCGSMLPVVTMHGSPRQLDAGIFTDVNIEQGLGSYSSGICTWESTNAVVESLSAGNHLCNTHKATMSMCIACLQATFTAAQQPPVHSTKPGMKALKVLPGQWPTLAHFFRNAVCHELAASTVDLSMLYKSSVRSAITY